MQSKAVEQRAHKLLEKYRVHSRREFFRVSAQEATKAVTLSSIEVVGISSWSHAEKHCLRSGDRLALALRAGQIFAFISYQSMSDLLTTYPKVIDL